MECEYTVEAAIKDGKAVGKFSGRYGVQKPIKGLLHGQIVSPHRSQAGDSQRDGLLLVVTPDFRSRKVWTVFAAHECEAAFWGLGFRNGIADTVGEVYEDQTITTDNALQKEPTVHTDGYLVIWKTGGFNERPR